ncbi:hypothetical protein IAT40_000504 [Kwoniella sp. CBS 6097]
MSRLPSTNDQPLMGPGVGFGSSFPGQSRGIGVGVGGFNSDASSSSSSAESSSSPFTTASLTPASVNDIPLPPRPPHPSTHTLTTHRSGPRHHHPHKIHQHQQQQQHRHHHHGHHEPVIPSTFLPSYHYSDSRFPPFTTESRSASAHSHITSHLPDDIKLSLPTLPFLHQSVDPSSSTSTSMGGLRGATGYGSGTPMMDLAGARTDSMRMLADTIGGDGDEDGGGGGSSHWSSRPQLGMSWTSLSYSEPESRSPAQQRQRSQAGPGPSALSNQQSHSQSQSPAGGHYRSLSNTSDSSGPHASSSNLAPPLFTSTSTSASASASGAGHLSPRYPPYTDTNPNPNTIASSSSRSMPSSSPAQQSMLPPPHPRSTSTSNANTNTNTSTNANANSNSNSNGNGYTARAWSEPEPTSFQDPSPQSAGYPGILFGSVPLPEGYNLVPPNGGRSVDEARLGPDDYAQALAIYNHLLSSLPHIVSNTLPSPDTPTGQGPTQDQGQGYPFDTLISLASNGLNLLTGQSPLLSLGLSDIASNTNGDAGASAKSNTAVDGVLGKGKRRNSNSGEKGGGGPGSGGVGVGVRAGGGGGNSEKKTTTKCLGCGATETPEWRRGPMGPRTLCNACGLVHMKLQRKKKKAEEKARAAASAAAAAVGEAGGKPG